MVKFVIKGTKPAVPQVEFELSVDEEGDIILEANGVPIAWIGEDGELQRYFVSRRTQENLPGLQFDDFRIVTR